MLNYTELLLTTYADRSVTLTGKGRDFVFTIHNPEWEGGDITVTCDEGRLYVDFLSMNVSLGDQFGEMVETVDELLHDETMLFEIYSHGENVLSGWRYTDEIDIDHSIASLIRSLSDGDRSLHREIKAFIAEGDCYCKLRGWRKARNRSIILS